MQWRRFAVPVTLSVGAIVGLTWWLVSEWRTKQLSLIPMALRVTEERQQAREAGLFVKPESLQFKGEKGAKSARAIYKAIDLDLIGIGEGSRPSTSPLTDVLNRERRSDEHRKATDELIAQCQSTLELAEQASHYPLADFGPPGDGRRELIRSAALAVDLLTARALREYEQGKPLVALRTLGIVRRLLPHFYQEKSSLSIAESQVGEIAVQRILREIVLQYPNDMEILRQAASLIQPKPNLTITDLQKVSRWNITANQISTKKSREEIYDPKDDMFLDYNRLWRWLDRLDYHLTRKEWNDGQEAVFFHYYSNLEKCLLESRSQTPCELWRSVEAYDARFSRDMDDLKIPSWSAPSFTGSLVRRDLYCQVHFASSQILLDIQRFRQVHGRFPQNLAEMGVPLPNDPFAAKPHPLRYKRGEDGVFLLYSVGENGVDDGGRKVRSRNGEGAARDIVFRLENPTPLPNVSSRPARPRRILSSLRQ